MPSADPNTRCGVIDATLGLGARAPGAVLGAAPAREIAAALSGLGVDGVECDPSTERADGAAIARAAVEIFGSARVYARCPTDEPSVDRAAACGAGWVVFEVTRLDASDAASGEGALPRAVARARRAGLRVCLEVSLGDSRDWDETARGNLLSHGADRLRVADHAGLLYPWEVEALVAGVRAWCGASHVEAWFADDCGMANANALAAAKAGAAAVVASVNGIGPRCGLTDTLVLAVNLGQMGLRTPPAGSAVRDISCLVRAHSRMRPDRWRPIIGDNACTAGRRDGDETSRRDVRAAEAAASRSGRPLCATPSRLPATLAGLINSPNVVSATELRHHRHGPGDRYLMIDERVVKDARQYCIVRHVPQGDPGPGHVDPHRHHVDSLFLFVGYESGLSGLRAEVCLGDETFVVESPCSVFIPSGVVHSYRVLSGSGIFVNHVLEGDYNTSLLKPAPAVEPPVAGGMAFVRAFVRDRLPGAVIEPHTRIIGVIDSLLFLDLFLHVEGAFGDRVSLDDVATCETFGQLASMLTAPSRAGPHRSVDGVA